VRFWVLGSGLSTPYNLEPGTWNLEPGTWNLEPIFAKATVGKAWNI